MVTGKLVVCNEWNNLCQDPLQSLGINVTRVTLLSRVMKLLSESHFSEKHDARLLANNRGMVSNVII